MWLVQVVQGRWVASVRHFVLDATIALELLLQHAQASHSATNCTDAIQPSYLNHVCSTVNPVLVATLTPPSRILMRLPNDVSHKHVSDIFVAHNLSISHCDINDRRSLKV